MEGMDRIKARIAEDARAEADRVLEEARAQAKTIADDYARRAQQAAAEVTQRGETAAAQREERLASMAVMEGRKALLAAKQEMVAAAFDQALETLCALPEAEYTALLAALAVQAARTGREEVILSPADRKRVGKAVVTAANAVLAKQTAPELPDSLGGSRAGALLEKVITAGSALLTGNAQLTLSERTAPMRGGLILADGAVEVNCAFETLIRLAKADLSAQVAKVLFE